MNLTTILKMTEQEAIEYLETIRWNNNPVCPHCQSDNVGKLEGKSTRIGTYKCKNKTCRKQFRVTVGTIFEDSHISLVKWIAAFYLVCSSKKGISSNQLSRDLDITYKSAWHMTHRIRHAMNHESFDAPLKGDVEVDETYIGGKKRGGKRGRGTSKTPVLALVERDGNVRSQVVHRVSAKELKGAIRKNVHPDSTIYTDEWKSYKGIGKEFKGGHKVVNHGLKEYVNGDAYTNTAECYFSLMKRGVNGIFHHISKEHLQRYCTEFDFRWNNRKVSEGEMVNTAIKMSEGKRLQYKNRIKSLTKDIDI